MKKKTEEIVNQKIFGRDWEDIKLMQMGKYVRKTINLNAKKREATDDDKELLEKHGEEGLRQKGFHGVLDRLETSGLLKNER